MNMVNHRLNINGAPEVVRAAARELLALQDDARILVLFGRYKEDPKIKWKGSIKEVVGIPAPEEKGLDI